MKKEQKLVSTIDKANGLLCSNEGWYVVNIWGFVHSSNFGFKGFMDDVKLYSDIREIFILLERKIVKLTK